MHNEIRKKYAIQYFTINPKHGLYYNKVKKHDAWVIIDEIIGCRAGEAKKKMDSMLASYRREKAKGKKSVGTGKGIFLLQINFSLVTIILFSLWQAGMKFIFRSGLRFHVWRLYWTEMNQEKH